MHQRHARRLLGHLLALKRSEIAYVEAAFMMYLAASTPNSKIIPALYQTLE